MFRYTYNVLVMYQHLFYSEKKNTSFGKYQILSTSYMLFKIILILKEVKFIIVCWKMLHYSDQLMLMGIADISARHRISTTSPHCLAVTQASVNRTQALHVTRLRLGVTWVKRRTTRRYLNVRRVSAVTVRRRDAITVLINAPCTMELHTNNTKLTRLELRRC